MRLQKFLAHAGVCSRRAGEALIEAGRVSVDGRIVRKLGTTVDPTRSVVRVDGRIVALEEPVVYLMNKPDDVVCSAEPETDDRGRPTVRSLLPGVRERIYPVGRLDFRTKGALFLTNDGELAAALTHPRHRVPKTYHVKFQGRLSEADLEALRRGVRLDDGVVTAPIEELFVLGETEANTWVQMTLHQGLNRQIRRMGDAIGHFVLKLVRVAIFDFTVEDLPEGKARRLEPHEVARLRRLAGLSAPRPGEPGGRRARRRRGGRR
ncbi:MAG: rRNA pseudouridine synthase [Deltaproteobacteria bacterium]|nr:MAG: rRNA pseudouridine synthase [Deltaproteobacteria bacterium]